MFGVVVRAPVAPSQELLERVIEDVTASNAEFFISEWQAGREPPCCLGCGAVKYRPDRPSSTTEILGAAELLREGKASCQSAAAYAAGHGRASAMMDGMRAEEASWAHRVILVEQDRRDAPDGYWHALVVTPDGVVDVTEEMDR